MTTKCCFPYGAWPSPISAEQVAWTTTTFDAVQMDGRAVYWIEGGAGGDVLVCRSMAEPTRPPAGGAGGGTAEHAGASRRDTVLPEGIGVTSTVHEHGGGAYLATSRGVWFSRSSDHRIWRTTPDGLAPVTTVAGDWRFADMRITAEGLLVCVRERHEPGRVVEELVAMPALSCTEPRVIASGWDFYSFPRPSPDGRRLAWTSWRRPFMCALRGRWGLADVSDCVYAVAHLADVGRIDPSRVAISGASAGGYTALRALATTAAFSTGVVRSAVVDPALWRAVAPRFQAHQVDTLIGPWPEAQELYSERSVLWHADAITSPMLIVHGDRDRVTPLRHTRFLAQRSTRPGSLLALTGEGHTIRLPANVACALRAELAHYRETLALPCSTTAPA